MTIRDKEAKVPTVLIIFVTSEGIITSGKMNANINNASHGFHCISLNLFATFTIITHNKDSTATNEKRAENKFIK